MADITIAGLAGKTPLETDEIEIQATAGGASNKATLADVKTLFTPAATARLSLTGFSRAILQEAYDDLSAGDGGVIELAAGDGYEFDGTAITVKNGVKLRGAGMGATILRQTVTATRLFTRTGSFADQIDYAAFEDFTCYGMWEGNQTMGGDNDRHFYVAGVKRIAFRGVESIYCRQMGITANYYDELSFTGCRIRYCARDGLNVSGGRRGVVSGNHFVGIGDDAIAIHQIAAAGNPPCEGHVVTNNTIEDAQGIKMLGAAKGVIGLNAFRRVKGAGIFIYVDGTEGYSDANSLVVANNTFTDIINTLKFGGGSLAVGILIGSASKSWQEPVVGGATPDINKPEDFYYLSNHATNQSAGGHGIKVSGNVINGFTFPVTNYSDWGCGEAFTASGFVDPDLSTGFKFSAQGIRLSGALLSVSIHDNDIFGTTSPIAVDSGLTALKLLTVRNNNLVRYSVHGLSLETATVLHGKVVYENNYVDADPYLEHASHNSDGTWNSGAQTPTAFSAVNWKGISARHNTYRNLNQVRHSDADTLSIDGPNTYIMEPNSAATMASFGTANKGIRRPDGLGAPGSLLVWEDSTPTNATTYGQELGRNSLSASAMPTVGYYMAGQFVHNTAFAETGSPAYTVLGWKRLTTSNAHVLNTDWRELRCLTGN